MGKGFFAVAVPWPLAFAILPKKKSVSIVIRKKKNTTPRFEADCSARCDAGSSDDLSRCLRNETLGSS